MSPDNPIQGAGTDRHPAATSGNRCGYATVVFAGQCDAQDPSPRTQAPHGTTARWNAGCGCVTCRRAHSDIARIRKRAKADARLPVEVRQQLLDQINAGQPFKAALRDLGLTPNRVWGLAQTDEEWSTALEAAVMATRRDALKHGTNAAYVAGCVCKECREHQRVRMGRNR